MATSFVQDLWESIFTPGPTPSILKATNASFAALQLVLLVLLIATYSIHFVILSGLSAGLWWAINWFAAELQAAQEREERDKARAAKDAAGEGAASGDDSAGAGHDSSDTEVEDGRPPTVGVPTMRQGGSREVEAVAARGELKQRAAAATLAPPESTGTQSSASTEDEWERVSENENEKDK